MNMNRKLRYVPALEESEDLQHFFNMEDLCGVHYDYLLMKLKAVFGSCLCIDIVLQFIFASHLVAGYMHLCLNISDDYEYIVMLMPTKPVLAETSARIMNVCLTELIN
ncbi:14955_t:CDS:2 [Gigaspora margarita]|uniref:14955_t:CDS:1 n=1 Tax=Gigaspora margarita TaxID=4874 RepID=A0ABN7VDF5_GIGMA|nr:14955_t:CDS:2 [Gigaspora margarita]